MARIQPDLPTGFNKLMRRQVQDILLVSSLYDSFLLAQDGQIREQMISQYIELNLQHTPGLTRVSTASEALGMAADDPRLNLIIATMHVGDMHVLDFARKVQESRLDVPVMLLAFDHQELKELMTIRDTTAVERAFIWQGDFRILLAIVKYIEDRWNADHDSREMGVQNIILIEDGIRFYSSYLPEIYTELMNQSRRLISDSVNLDHRVLRMRARPKILLSSTFEKAWSDYMVHEDHILGVISDIEFPRGGVKDADAGAVFAKFVKQRRPDIPILLQSSQERVADLARELGTSYVRKDSPTLLREVREFMIDNFGFGDFVFRMPDGTEIDRARDMRELQDKLSSVPDDCIRFHAERDHFSRWMKARTEFKLAEQLKPRKVTDYPSLDGLRRYLIESVSAHIRERSMGLVADFDRRMTPVEGGFMRVGGGSLGGKARGLAFVNHLLKNNPQQQHFNNIHISVPPSTVLCTDVFDDFLDRNNLRDFAIQSKDEEKIRRRFKKGRFSRDVRRILSDFLQSVQYPIAVRSSSLLEDSQYHPFAGIYLTRMLPNSDPDPAVRLEQLLNAIREVYASTYSRRAKNYIKATLYRLEEEKMAVIIQKLVGTVHGDRFYPDIAGVARSHNFYPTPPIKPEDGVISVALGLGKTVVEGGSAVRFCPKYPKRLIQFSTTKDILEYSQKSFFALDMKEPREDVVNYGLEVAEEDGTLGLVGSVYSAENDAIYDGLSRQGMRIVTFAPVLKQNMFPLAEISERILMLGCRGMSCPVEIEFAVNTSRDKNTPTEFGILQMRPFVFSRELEDVEIGPVKDDELICRSASVLGMGKVGGIHDAVVVDADRFVRADSRIAADEVGRFNSILQEENRPYLLVGVGRWGSADPWLGIPVKWDQISGARVIVEAGLKDFRVVPSQGAHFFQNLTALMIGYFTVNPDAGEGWVDWSWLAEQPAVEEGKYARHIRFDHPVVAKMNGHNNEGVILKPV